MFKTTLCFEDNLYPNHGFDHVREVARGIVLNEKNEIPLLKIYCDDIFGHRDHYETPGGGIEKNETKEEALKRELNEEIGAEVEIIAPLLVTEDYYNLIKRKTISYYYLCRLKSLHQNNLLPEEKTFIKGMVWVSLDKAIDLYQNAMIGKVAKLIQQRELPVLLMAKEMIDKAK